MGPDQEPLRLPLSTTRDELADMCGADTYRVYAIDDVGEVITHVSTVNVGLEPRNANATSFDPQSSTKALYATTTDLRYALETITHMARTSAEAMRSLAESQADLVKAVALTKGLRNVAMPPPPPPSREDDDEDVDDNEDDEDDEPEPRSPQTSAIESIATMIGPFSPGLMESWNIKKAGAANDASVQSQPTVANPMAHLARIQLRLTNPERRFLEALLADPESGDAIAADFATKTVDDVVTLVQRGASGIPTPRPAPSRRPISFTDPAVMQKVIAVSKHLEPGEHARLMKLAPRLMGSPEAQELATRLMALSDESAAGWIRTQLDEIERRFAS